MGQRKPTDVQVSRIHHGEVYARVSQIGQVGTRAFLLIPGIGISANYFEQLAAELNEFGPVISLDLPGFGGVPHPHGRRMKIADYADLIDTVITELGLVDPIVVGHSMGTQIAAEYAARDRPDRPRSLILLGPVINPAERRPLTVLRRFLQSCRYEPPRVAALAVYSYLLCGPRWFARTVPELLSYPIEERLPKITASTLIIGGEQDRLCPQSWLERAAELLPRSRTWIIPGGSHSVMHAHAEQVARLCVEHARDPEHPDFNRAMIAADAGPTPAHEDSAQQFVGQVQEFVGIVTDNDATIAAGRTAQAEALEVKLPTRSGGAD